MIADPYLATKDIEVKKRLISEYLRNRLTLNDLEHKSYRKVSELWRSRAKRIFKSWTNAIEEIFCQEKKVITDNYLYTKDIKERKRIVSEHMKAHLDSNNLSLSYYEQNFPGWGYRAKSTFKKWSLAIKYVFGKDVFIHWHDKYLKDAAQKSNKQYIKDKKDIKKDFVKEYLRLKSIPEFGHFSYKKYNKYRSKDSPSGHTIIKKFGGKEFYKEVAHDYPDIYFDPIKPYDEEDYKNSLVKAYQDNGFICCEILKFDHGYITSGSYIEKYKSIENACKKFNIPYENKVQDSKLSKQARKIIKKLLPLEMIKEKTWSWLKYKQLLQIDIFIPFLNLAIEIDGRQHDKEVPLWSRNGQTLEVRQLRDKIKDIELPKHNITLIRIKYNEINKIPEILKPYVELLKIIQEYCAY